MSFQTRGLHLLSLCAILLLFLPGCAPFGYFSLRSEATSLYREAVELSAGIDKKLISGRQPTAADRVVLEESLGLARKAAAVDPTFPPPHLMAFLILNYFKRHQECEELLSYILEIFPDEDLFREEAVFWELQVAENRARAARLLEEGLRRHPNSLRFHLVEAEFLAQTEAPREEIVAKIETITAFRFIDGASWIRLIALCAILAESDIDSDLTGPLLELAQRNPLILNNCIVSLLERGLDKSAGKLFVSASSLPEANFALKHTTARLLVWLKEKEGVARLLAELTRDAATEAETASLLVIEGYLLWLEEKPEAALPLFLKALERNPIDIEALDGAWILYEEASLLSADEMRGLLEKAVETARDPRVRQFLLLKARTLLKAKNNPDGNQGWLRSPGNNRPFRQRSRKDRSPIAARTTVSPRNVCTMSPVS